MKLLQKIILVGFFVVLFCVNFTTNTDFSQDLGRHLKLGEIIVTTHQIPKTNLFSYTNPAFPFINHHWFAEIIYYLLVAHIGLYSLTILKVVLLFVTFLFLYKSVIKKGNVVIFTFISLLFLPLMLDRLDIRPELFGYFFFSLLLYILFFQTNRKILYMVPFVMMSWINMHITFVFGLFLISVYCLLRARHLHKQILIPIFLSFCGLLINPNGVDAILYPFNIFRNYGYSIVENQNMFFLHSVTFNPFINYFILLSPFVLGSLFVLVARKKYVFALILFVFFLLPVWQIRHMPFFVLTVVPMVGYTISQFITEWKFSRKVRAIFYSVTIIFLAGFILLFTTNTYYRVFDKDKSFGLGFDENQKQATDFILARKLPGNIFNNFDIGGYAIYRLYPTYNVFVDNRPEAYPASFFTQVYIPMQQDASFRKKIFRQYGIHTILFSHTDMTPWGIQFLSEIVHDQEWKLVFLNKSTVVVTDDLSFTDIRNGDSLTGLIDNENNSISLIQLSSIFLHIDKKEESTRALKKAEIVNPDSCVIKRNRYETMQSNPIDFLQNDLKTTSWWCF